MDFLIATHNMKKRAELERILKPNGVRILKSRQRLQRERYALHRRRLRACR